MPPDDGSWWLVPLLSIPLLPLLIVAVWFYMPREGLYRLMTRWGLLRWEIASAFAIFVVASLFILLAANAQAQTLAGANAAAVDLTPLINESIKFVAAILGALLIWIVHRGVALLESMHALNSSQVHLASIDSQAQTLADWTANQLGAIADDHAKVEVKSAMLAKAAQMLIDQAPLAVAATGLTPAGAKALIQVKLDPPNPTVADPAPAPAP